MFDREIKDEKRLHAGVSTETLMLGDHVPCIFGHVHRTNAILWVQAKSKKANKSLGEKSEDWMKEGFGVSQCQINVSM